MNVAQEVHTQRSLLDYRTTLHCATRTTLASLFFGCYSCLLCILCPLIESPSRDLQDLHTSIHIHTFIHTYFCTAQASKVQRKFVIFCVAIFLIKYKPSSARFAMFMLNFAEIVSEFREYFQKIERSQRSAEIVFQVLHVLHVNHISYM